MENNSRNKNSVLLPLGILLLILGLTLLKDAGAPKFLILGASIAMLGYSAYTSIMSSESNRDRQE